MYALINGGVPPVGRVRVSGAKNSATRLLAASLLSNAPVQLTNFPTHLVDVGHKIRFCELLGASIDVDYEAEALNIDASRVASPQLTRDQYDVPIRTTYLLAAAQLLRSGVARIPYPGGCPIGPGDAGSRGYDLHILVWEALGCSVTELPDHILIEAPRGMRGGEIDFPITTVGGTENALISGSVANGQTVVQNAYITPEVQDLIDLLRRMGARITVTGTSHVVIDGAGGPISGAHMSVMSDRIEALTWIVYAAISGGSLTVDEVPFDAMEVPLIHLEQSGIDLFRNSHSVHVTSECLRSGSIQPFEVACGSHPGIISDMQAFYVMLGLRAEGTSRIFDYRYPERIAFANELSKLVPTGHLSAERGKITTRGSTTFNPGTANSTDLRGSMAVVLAGLCADGSSRINGVQMALRGYNNLEAKLRALGADIAIYSENE